MGAAREVMERHRDTINNRDVEVYRRTMNFPFTHQNYNGVALTIDKSDDVGISAALPWDIVLGTHPNWHHTDFDFIEEVARSVSSAVFKVGFSRADTTGHAYGYYHAIWIATCQNRRWGFTFVTIWGNVRMSSKYSIA